MDQIRRRLLVGLSPVVAVPVAWMLGLIRPGVVRAGSSGRSGESMAATGATSIQQSADGKGQVPLETVYWIDYRSAKLFATTPEVSRTAAASGVIGEIAVRDLIDDFKIADGVTPHFLMNTASLGALGGGSSVLMVIETTTRQVGVYWSTTRSTGINARPEFDLVEVKSYAAFAPNASADRFESVSTSGSVIMQMSMDKKQIPLDAVYWVEFNSESARLFALIPEVRKTSGRSQMIGDVGVRDLADDFKLPKETQANFMLSTASLAALQMGMSALFVIETTTNQIGVYRVFPKSTVQGPKPEIELLKVKAYEQTPPPLPGN